jgi:hypothetical protein
MISDPAGLGRWAEVTLTSVVAVRDCPIMILAGVRTANSLTPPLKRTSVPFAVLDNRILARLDAPVPLVDLARAESNVAFHLAVSRASGPDMGSEGVVASVVALGVDMGSAAEECEAVAVAAIGKK